MPQKLPEEELQDKYQQFKALQEQIEQLGQQAEMLNQQNAELEISRKALQELEKVALNTEVLAQIANGIFIRTKLQDNQNLIINIGSNVTVERTIPEVITLLEEQKKEMALHIIEAEAVMQELQAQAHQIYEEVQRQD